jgi:hypothetical protein
MSAVRWVILACAWLSITSAHSQPAQAQALDRETGSIVMVGGYIGMAEFCTAYGVDFRSLANMVRDGMRQNVFPNYADPNRMAFEDGVRWGTRGMVYSPQAGDFLNMANNGSDMRQFCQFAHQKMVQISQMK